MKKILASLFYFVFFHFLHLLKRKTPQCPSDNMLMPQTQLFKKAKRCFFLLLVGSEEKNYNVKYKWTVDKGTIINGQGTTVIQVSTEGLSDTTVTATFEIEGITERLCQYRF